MVICENLPIWQYSSAQGTQGTQRKNWNDYNFVSASVDTFGIFQINDLLLKCLQTV